MIIGNSINANHVNSHFAHTGLGNNQDAQLKSIQTQISFVQKQIQSLSENKDMSLEQKMNKRKELQRQLQDLNKQAMLRQLEIQKEQREKTAKKQESPKDPENSVSGSMDAVTIQGIINADTALSRARTISTEKNEMEGQAGVLEIEIKLDEGRGASVEHKEAKLTDLKDKIGDASSSMMKQISDSTKALEKSKDSEEDTVHKKQNNKEKETDEIVYSSEKSSKNEDNSMAEAKKDDAHQMASYVPIDISI